MIRKSKYLVSAVLFSLMLTPVTAENNKFTLYELNTQDYNYFSPVFHQLNEYFQRTNAQSQISIRYLGSIHQDQYANEYGTQSFNSITEARVFATGLGISLMSEQAGSFTAYTYDVPDFGSIPVWIEGNQHNTQIGFLTVTTPDQNIALKKLIRQLVKMYHQLTEQRGDTTFERRQSEIPRYFSFIQVTIDSQIDNPEHQLSEDLSSTLSSVPTRPIVVMVNEDWFYIVERNLSESNYRLLEINNTRHALHSSHYSNTDQLASVFVESHRLARSGQSPSDINQEHLAESNLQPVAASTATPPGLDQPPANKAGTISAAVYWLSYLFYYVMNSNPVLSRR